MKIKHLTLSFLACASLAGCVNSNTAEGPYSVVCKDNQGIVTFEGHAKNGLTGSSDTVYAYVRIETIDGQVHEQSGGTCTSQATGDTPYIVECKDSQGNATFKGRAKQGLQKSGSYVHIDATDGSRFEQAGGICISSKRAALKPN